MDERLNHLATTLKEERAGRGWSLARTAELTGVSKAMLGQIERGESSPTVATLWKIATGFNLPFSHFIGTQQAEPHLPRRPPSHYAAGDQQMRATALIPFDTELCFEMLLIELSGGALSESAAHESGVVEHVMVLEGELEVAVAGEIRRLKSGESLRFQADRPHSYHNPQAESVRFHDLIHYPRR